MTPTMFAPSVIHRPRTIAITIKAFDDTSTPSIDLRLGNLSVGVSVKALETPYAQWIGQPHP